MLVLVNEAIHQPECLVGIDMSIEVANNGGLWWVRRYPASPSI